MTLMIAVLPGCSSQPRSDDRGGRREHAQEQVIGERIVTCQDGTQADIDFLDDGLRMSVTWLPGGPSEVLTASRTGEPYQGKQTRAVVAGGTIAFQRGTTFVRICRRVQ